MSYAEIKREPRRRPSPGRGFALIEVMITLGILTVVGVFMYQSFAGLLEVLAMSRGQQAATELMREQIEIVRNLPFASVGEVNGIPAGSLVSNKTVTRNGHTFSVNTTVQNVDDPFDGTIGGSPNDSAPADYRRVEVTVACTSCERVKPMTFTTTQAPKSLEASGSQGALFVRVLDASGAAVPDAAVHVVNQATNPDTIIDDTTDNNGWLRIVGAPPGTNAYEITVTKSGFSTDRTYVPNGAGLNSPAKPHATVAASQVTQVTFSIDELGSMNVRTVADNCAPMPDIDFSLRGAKTLGTNSGTTIYKYNQNLSTDGTGNLSLPSMEWDTYSPTITSSGYYLSGSVPTVPIAVLPGEASSLSLVAEAATPRILVVTVKDASTGLPVTDAQVAISRSGFTTQTLYTGRGFLGQTTWTGASGQADYVDAARYYVQDGNVTVNTPSPGVAGEMRLKRTGSVYATAGNLTSSTFDTGSASNFHQILWQPTNQPSQSGTNSVRMQIATNATNDGTETWDFVGPDGTAATYYTATSNTIHSSHDDHRYLRYRIFLSTSNTSYSPNVADVNFTFTSTCVPPGQVMFSGLSSSSNHTYTVRVTKTGYNTSVTTKQLTGNWQEHTVTLNP